MFLDSLGFRCGGVSLYQSVDCDYIMCEMTLQESAGTQVPCEAIERCIHKSAIGLGGWSESRLADRDRLLWLVIAYGLGRVLR